MSQNEINKLIQNVTLCDTYAQLSVFGSWQFLVNAACINQAMRYVPEGPVHNGIEEFTQYEAARRALLKDAENSQLPSLIALAREISNLTNEADGEARGLEDTLEFLTREAPKRETYEREFEERRRQGMKPNMAKRIFVDTEFQNALDSFNNTIAKGEDAVRLCETVTIQGRDDFNNLPDWITESMQNKLIEKLHARWEKLEFIRSNPRRKKTIRDSAQADQMLIAKVLAKYGETPGFSDIDDPSEEADIDVDASAGDLSDLDPKAPGPVKIISPEDYAKQAA